MSKEMKKEVTKLKRAVASLKSDQEYKDFSAVPSVSYASDYKAVINLYGSAIGQGTAYNQRIGNEINIKGVRLNVLLNGPNLSVTSTTLRQPYRVILFQDRSGTSTPQADEILENIAISSNYASIMSGYNYDFVCRKGDMKNRYKILYDKSGFLAPKGESGGRTTLLINKLITRGFDKKMNFAGGATGDYKSGCFWILVLCGIDATASNNNGFVMSPQVFFTD